MRRAGSIPKGSQLQTAGMVYLQPLYNWLGAFSTCFPINSPPVGPLTYLLTLSFPSVSHSKLNWPKVMCS